MGLSKSRYTQCVQCMKMLWMKENMPEWFDDSILDQRVLTMGNDVGDLAMGYYGDYVEVPFTQGNYNPMIRCTKELLDVGTHVICEATFAVDNNLCMVDILRVEEDGVRIDEVKSSTHLKDIHYHDVAYQYWVLSKCGLNVKSASLMHLNKDYVRAGELDLHALFVSEDITEKVVALQHEVTERIAAIEEMLASGTEPSIEPGPWCGAPYTCGYKQWCWRNMPSPNVFDLNGKGCASGFKLWNSGIRSMEDALDRASLNKRQRVQAEVELGEEDERIMHDEVRHFLEELSFPLYFLDFETFIPAIPPFDRTRPYEQIVSQYSLHVVRSDDDVKVHREQDGTLVHKEFLGEGGGDPRRAAAEALCRDIPASACTVAYNMSFEKARLSELSNLFPDLSEHLLSIRENMHDLLDPFKSGIYYAKGMGGSNSIKQVLPTLFPDNPELDYHGLEGVHNGGEAAETFEMLAKLPPEQIETTRAQLLAYCRLDTLALVRIWEKLKGAAAKSR